MTSSFATQRRVFAALVLLGMALRISFVAMAGGTALTFHSGGSDAPAYNLLAKNLVAHRGFSYSGLPSAFRPPGYPLLLAGFMSIFPHHYVLLVRWMQFVIGLLTVGVCSLAASRLFGDAAGQATFIAGLFLPTLIFTTAQMLTECLAAFLTSLFLLFLIRQLERADRASATGLGLTAGMEALVRFNGAALPLFAGWAVLRTRRKKWFWLRAAAALLIPLLLVSPWLARNLIVFHGRALLSTQVGAVAVQGVITPEGRTQVSDADRLVRTMGWTVSELETNSPERRSLPSEAELNLNALKVVPGLWKAVGWKIPLLLTRKIAVFWFSLDQVVDTKSFSLEDRVIRFGGVLCYWVVLALAIAGWFTLREIRPAVASTFLIYAVGLTVMHLPLTMNTRLRVPLLEPLFVILAGAGWVRFAGWWDHSARTASGPQGSENIPRQPDR